MKKLISVVVLLILTLLCCSGCAENVQFYSAKIYHASIATDEGENCVYVKSVEELKSYYDSSKDGLESMKEEVFDYYKYDEDYFSNKCILFIFHRLTPGVSNEDITSISLSNNILTVKASHTGLTDNVVPIVVVIELDKKYAGTEVKFIMEGRRRY